jgi:formylglycine-generating enzyme required for sulfatase activity
MRVRNAIVAIVLASLAACDRGRQPETRATNAAAADAASVADPFDGAKAGEERTIAGMRWCWCPAGRFVMGSPKDEAERRPGEDQVTVRLTHGFWMSKHETTQGDWRRLVGDFPAPTIAGQGDDYPVHSVNYADTRRFCEALTASARASGALPTSWTVRLPTEAQWEYACRAGTTTATSFGPSLSSTQANFLGEKPYGGGAPGPSLGHATPVGSYPANPWGLHDVHGNIYEWVRDWYHARLPGGDDPDLSEVPGTPSEHGTRSRSRRGGAFTDVGWPLRCAFRLRFEPERRSDHIGFRAAVVFQLR